MFNDNFWATKYSGLQVTMVELRYQDSTLRSKIEYIRGNFTALFGE